MFATLPLPVLVLIFAAAAAAVWVAGISLSGATDALSTRLGLGEALGGLIFLAIATNLPEIAITVSAALTNNLGIAISNILGGIAIQTVVLALVDLRMHPPLTYMAASLTLVLEGVMVIAVLVVAIMGNGLPSSLIVARVSPAGLLIVILWLAGLWLLNRARKGLPWQATDDGHVERAPGATKGARAPDKDNGARRSVTREAVVFAVAAAVTLAAGVALEESGNAMAGHIGMTGVLFGATFLAAATSLPEMSTGLASIKLGDYELAVSDIFGGNAFLPVLFLLASLLSGQAVLPLAQRTDIYLAALGILLTTVYLYGLIFRSQRRILRLGVDSFVVLLLYALGILGLVAVAHG